jgi:glycerophosphoryl diester phosphodiesterase
MTRPAISAHRGKTWESFQDALDSGAEYVEFDIRRSGDGKFVVYHDSLGSQSHAALCRSAGYDVPLVADVMKLIAGRMKAHLDLKEIGDEVAIVEQALAILGDGSFVVTTLEDVSVAVVKRAFPQVKTLLSLGRDAAGISRRRLAAVRASEFFPLRRLRACGADGAALNHQLASNVLRVCARNRLFAMVWTVNDEALMRRFIADPRVDVLVTDHPRRAVELRAG